MSSEQSNLGGLTWQTWSSLKTLTSAPILTDTLAPSLDSMRPSRYPPSACHQEELLQSSTVIYSVCFLSQCSTRICVANLTKISRNNYRSSQSYWNQKKILCCYWMKGPHQYKLNLINIKKLFYETPLMKFKKRNNIYFNKKLPLKMFCSFFVIWWCFLIYDQRLVSFY